MDLDKKYELGTVVANDSESKTFQAKELATGRAVLVHILFGGASQPGRETLLSMLLKRAVDPSAERRAAILEISDHKGMAYVATQVLEGFTNLRTWLEGGAAAATPAAAAPPQKDEFAKLFGLRPAPAEPAVAPARPAPQPARPAEPAPVPPPPRTTASRPPQPPPEVGTFTQLYVATVGEPMERKASGKAPTAVPPPAPAPAGSTSEAGEFTRLFQAPAASNSLPPEPAAAPDWGTAPKPPASGQGGEFTQLFHASPEAPSAMPESPPSPGAGSSAPGQFTSLFQTPESGEPGSSFAAAPPPPSEPSFTAPLPPPPKRPPGEFTRLYGEGQEHGSPLFQAPAPPPPLQPQGATGVFSQPAARPQPAPASTGPGEYTRLFGAPAAPGSPDAGTAPPPAGQPSAPQYPGMQLPGVPPMQAPHAPGIPMPGAAPIQVPQTRGLPPMQVPMQAPAVPAMQVPAKPSGPSNWLVIVIVAVLIVAILGLIVFFIMKK
jgi:hypothetical protein